MSAPPVLSMSTVGKAMVCLSYQRDAAQHSLVKQAEAQGALVAGTVTEVQAGRAVLAPLHPDEGLDLSAHLELHYGLDQWPVGTTAVGTGAAEVFVGATTGCLSSPSLLLVPIVPPTSGVLTFSSDLTVYGCHGIPSHTLCPTPISPESSGQQQWIPHCSLACLFQIWWSWLLAVPP